MTKIRVGDGWVEEYLVPAGGEEGDHLIKTTNADGAYDWQAPPPPPPGSLEGIWHWTATPVTAHGGPGQVGVNTDDPRVATTLYVSAVDADGSDRAAMFDGLNQYDTVAFTVVGVPDSWHRYELTAAGVAVPGGYQLPVATAAGSVTGTEPATGAEVVTVVDRAGIPADAVVTGPQGPAGASASLFRYSYSSVASPPPNTGQVRSNGANAAATTMVWVHRLDNQSQDERLLLLQAEAGDELFVQDQQDSTSYVRYTLTADPVDNTNYVTFAVTATEVGAPLVGAGVMLGVVRPGPPGPEGPAGPEGPPGGPTVVAVPYDQWPPAAPQPDVLYLRLAP
jgi:hypothetical protein